MWYVVQDNYAGGCALFDNIEDCKRFVKQWRQSDDYDPENFTIYENAPINPDYNTYMNSPCATDIKF